MKRLTCYEGPSLDDLLTLAASFDQGRLSLDSDELHELLNRLLTDAQAKLCIDSKLRLGSVSLAKDLSGNVTVGLKQRGLSVQSLKHAVATLVPPNAPCFSKKITFQN